MLVLIMAKYELRIKARNMRQKGESVKDIAKKLAVSKGTVSLWVRDIILSVEQMEKLKQKSIKGGELGRLKGSLMQKERRLRMIEEEKKSGIIRVGELTNRELLLTGVALYWAEGSKKRRVSSVCNSDPRLINFMIGWLKKCFDIKSEELAVNVGINEIHKAREGVVKKYWSKIAGIPLSQFRKTSFKKSKVNKVYENYNDHYGTFNVKVLKSAKIYYKIMGLIEGLSRQGSSVG